MIRIALVCSLVFATGCMATSQTPGLATGARPDCGGVHDRNQTPPTAGAVHAATDKGKSKGNARKLDDDDDLYEGME